MVQFMEKKKRGPVKAILFGLITFILVLLLMVFEYSLLAIQSVNNIPDSARAMLKSEMDYDIGKMNVGKILKETNPEKHYDEDMTVSEFVYDSLSKDQKKKISQKDIDDVFASTKDFTDYSADVMADYSAVMLGEKQSASIKSEDIMEIIEKNEKEISLVIGRDLTSKDYKNMQKVMDEIKLDKNTKLTRDDLADVFATDEQLEAFETFYRHHDTIIAILVFMIFFIAFLIFLFNLHSKPRVFFITGLATIFVGASAFILTAFGKGALIEAAKTEKGVGFAIGKALADCVFEAIVKSAKVYIITGFVLIFVYVIFKILGNVLRSRREILNTVDNIYDDNRVNNFEHGDTGSFNNKDTSSEYTDTVKSAFAGVFGASTGDTTNTATVEQKPINEELTYTKADADDLPGVSDLIEENKGSLLEEEINK